MQIVAEGLQFPTSLVLDDEGWAYVAESGLRFDGEPGRARVLRMDLRGEAEPSVLCEDFRAPVNGLTLHEGVLYVAEGGCPGCISRLELDGRKTILVDDLPGGGNYHTNMVAIGPDRKLYFGQGAMTNSGIVGADAQQLSWLRNLPHPHDLPGLDIVLTGADERTDNPLDPDGPPVTTGAFAAFASAHPAGTRLPARLPCTAAIMRCNLDGSGLELVAWGLRNPYGLGFSPEGRLLALDLGMNDRGSRPVGNAPSCLFAIEPGAWYGWPDFVAGVAVDDPSYQPDRGARPRFLLANHAELPPPRAPLVSFVARSAAVKFAFGGDRLYVALFGDKRPFTAPPGPAAGRAVVRVDPRDWSIHPVVGAPLHRPIDLQIHPLDGELYVLDFGDFEMRGGDELDAVSASGKLWRVD